MTLPLHERAKSSMNDPLVRLTGGIFPGLQPAGVATLIPDRPLYPRGAIPLPLRHDEMHIDCPSCEIACNEQNGNPADIHWRRVGEVEGGVYIPNTQRHYLSSASITASMPMSSKATTVTLTRKTHLPESCSLPPMPLHRMSVLRVELPLPGATVQCRTRRGRQVRHVHGRLTDGLEPACVNACPNRRSKSRLSIRLCGELTMRRPSHPECPCRTHHLYHRITLPETAAEGLERVDTGHVRRNTHTRRRSS